VHATACMLHASVDPPLKRLPPPHTSVPASPGVPSAGVWAAQHFAAATQCPTCTSTCCGTTTSNSSPSRLGLRGIKHPSGCSSSNHRLARHTFHTSRANSSVCSTHTAHPCSARRPACCTPRLCERQCGQPRRRRRRRLCSAALASRATHQHTNPTTAARRLQGSTFAGHSAPNTSGSIPCTSSSSSAGQVVRSISQPAGSPFCR